MHIMNISCPYVFLEIKSISANTAVTIFMVNVVGLRWFPEATTSFPQPSGCSILDTTPPITPSFPTYNPLHFGTHQRHSSERWQMVCQYSIQFIPDTCIIYISICIYFWCPGETNLPVISWR